VKYILVDSEYAIKNNIPHPWDDDWEDEDDWDYRIYLYLQKDDGEYEFIASDGGEPEDNTFRRDWSWVPGELNKALAYGS
jgi:hypothetical protein